MMNWIDDNDKRKRGKSQIDPKDWEKEGLGWIELNGNWEWGRGEGREGGGGDEFLRGREKEKAKAEYVYWEDREKWKDEIYIFDESCEVKEISGETQKKNESHRLRMWK